MLKKKKEQLVASSDEESISKLSPFRISIKAILSEHNVTSAICWDHSLIKDRKFCPISKMFARWDPHILSVLVQFTNVQAKWNC